ncbi:MAG: glycosyltransferase family 2 protein [Candidatus Omnitrophica bacterium]|nr:glycosyltransferase family 2 protein [Candidatus Omnitrophota bacterium]
MDENIEVSVVLPCLNEEDSIGICIGKIKEVFLRDKVIGEIIVVDNGSKDRSKEIAASLGAKVFFEPEPGYGAAYLKGISEAKGKYIIIGDSDNTYDFYNTSIFLEKLRQGYDLVMGSRFKGKIHRGAMPWANRYIGNPILSGICRLFFRTSLSDIHCGMRAFTSSSCRRMQLKTLGMEFATEMVVAAIQNNLKICEIPVDYHLRQGESKLKPLADAWRHMRFMLLYCPLWLYFIPGVTGLVLGLSCALVLLKGPFLFLGRYWDVHVMAFSSVISILSYQVINLGVYAHIFAVTQGFLRHDKFMIFFGRYFSLEKGIVLGGVFFALGIGVSAFIFIDWFFKSFGELYRIRESIFAMTLLIIGLQTVFSSFFISLLLLKKTGK